MLVFCHWSWRIGTINLTIRGDSKGKKRYCDSQIVSILGKEKVALSSPTIIVYELRCAVISTAS